MEGVNFLSVSSSLPLLHSYLLKLFSQHLPSGQLPDNVAYLGSDYPVHTCSSVHTADQFMDLRMQLEAYRQRARRYV